VTAQHPVSILPSLSPRPYPATLRATLIVLRTSPLAPLSSSPHPASTSARAASSFLVQLELPASVSFAALVLLAANVPRFYLYLPLSFSLPFLTSLRTLVPQIAAIPPRARCPRCIACDPEFDRS